MEEEHRGLQRFDAYAAEQRRFWRALRDGGVIDLGETAGIIRRQVQGEELAP